MSLSRRRFFGLLAAAAAPLAAPRPRRLLAPLGVSRDMKSLLGVHVLQDVREPLPGAPLGIEQWQSWADHIAARVKPACLNTHREDAGGQVARGNRIDDERLLSLIAGAKPESHAGTGSRRRESLDLRQARPFELCDGLRPAVERALPGGYVALAEDRCGHASAPSVGNSRMVAELMIGCILLVVDAVDRGEVAPLALSSPEANESIDADGQSGFDPP